MKNSKVYIVHGYMASPTLHWFPWLKERLMDFGTTVKVLELPNSKRPKADAWAKFLSQELQDLDERCFIVGHSLGCVTVLNHLSTIPAESKIGGLVCVSGFSEPLPNIPYLNGFTNKKYDIARVKKIAMQRTVLVSEDDTIVAPEFTKRLSEELDATLISLPQGGHFMDSDGFYELPEVLSVLQEMMNDI